MIMLSQCVYEKVMIAIFEGRKAVYILSNYLDWVNLFPASEQIIFANHEKSF